MGRAQLSSSSTYKNDMYTIGSVAAMASEVKVPWLLIHGDADDVVPIEDSREIFACANEPKRIIEIPGANHVFSEGGLDPMSESVIDWIEKFFGNPKIYNLLYSVVFAKSTSYGGVGYNLDWEWSVGESVHCLSNSMPASELNFMR